LQSSRASMHGRPISVHLGSTQDADSANQALAHSAVKRWLVEPVDTEENPIYTHTHTNIHIQYTSFFPIIHIIKREGVKHNQGQHNQKVGILFFVFFSFIICISG